MQRRPSFVVSQFHGKNIAMSWFMAVQRLINGTTLKLIIWGDGPAQTGVPSMLFNLDTDPDEMRNLVATSASEVAALEKSIRSQVDYPTVARDVARYNIEIFKAWVRNTTNWQTVMAVSKRARLHSS